MSRRFQARRGSGRFTRNTMENTLGLHCDVRLSCRSLNPWRVGEAKPERCHNCQAPLTARECPRCKGRGTVVKTYDEYGMADPKDVPCPICDGSGKVVPAQAESSWRPANE